MIVCLLLVEQKKKTNAANNKLLSARLGLQKGKLQCREEKQMSPCIMMVFLHFQ